MVLLVVLKDGRKSRWMHIPQVFSNHSLTAERASKREIKEKEREESQTRRGRKGIGSVSDGNRYDSLRFLSAECTCVPLSVVVDV